MLRDIASALMDPSKQLAGLPARRLAVYRNNVAASLVGAMRAQFPAVARLLGDEFFAHTALAYVRAEPPRSVLLFEIGQGFGSFLDSDAAHARYPFVADVARLEYAMAFAQHAVDALPLSSSSLSGLTEDELAHLAFAWHPAAHLFVSEYPAVTICGQNRDDGEPGPISDWRGEAALITRPAMAVTVRSLPPGGVAFLSAVRAGELFPVAAERGLAASTSFDLAANIAGMFAAGAIVDLHLFPETKELPS